MHVVMAFLRYLAVFLWVFCVVGTAVVALVAGSLPFHETDPTRTANALVLAVPAWLGLAAILGIALISAGPKSERRYALAACEWAAVAGGMVAVKALAIEPTALPVIFGAVLGGCVLLYRDSQELLALGAPWAAALVWSAVGVGIAYGMATLP